MQCRIRLVSIFMLAGLMCLMGCKSEEKSQKIKVVSTTNIVHDLVVQIAGDHVESYSLMGAGVDPHLYKASEGDVHRLAKADIIFYSGLHLEAKLGELLEKMSRKRTVVAVTEGVPKQDLLASDVYENLPDPHVWFDISIWKVAALNVYKTLSEIDPKNKDVYQNNTTQLITRFEELDMQIRQELSRVPVSQRILVTAHDAFRYFGKAYDVEVIGLQGINTMSEASAQDVNNLANYVVQNQIPAIFVESSIPKRTIEAVQAAAKAKGWQVKIGGELYSDALGEPNSKGGTYIGMIESNVSTIVSGLLGNPHD